MAKPDIDTDRTQAEIATALKQALDSLSPIFPAIGAFNDRCGADAIERESKKLTDGLQASTAGERKKTAKLLAPFSIDPKSYLGKVIANVGAKR